MLFLLLNFIKNIDNTNIDIDNRWVVPHSRLRSKTYDALINVEFCSSMKSIRYICKYVNKGSDMTVFRVEYTNVNAPPVNNNDKMALYEIGWYISPKKLFVVSLIFQFMDGIQQLFIRPPS